MTKLQYLNAYLTERLTQAAEDILQAFGEAICEFQEEIRRTNSENQCLKRQLAARHQVPPQTQWFPALPAPPEPLEWSPGRGPVEVKEEVKTSPWHEEGQQEPAEEVVPPLPGSPDHHGDAPQSSELKQGHQHHGDAPQSSELKQGHQHHGDAPQTSELKQGHQHHGDAPQSSELKQGHQHHGDAPQSSELNQGHQQHHGNAPQTSELNQDHHGDSSPDFETKDSDFPLGDRIKTEPRKEGYDLSNLTDASSAHCSRTGDEESSARECEVQRTDSHEGPQPGEAAFPPDVQSNGDYSCTVCRKGFPSPRYLKLHMRSHGGRGGVGDGGGGDDPTQCGVCGKSFSSYGKLKEHQRLHTGERPFRCEFCGKHFNQNCNLKVHMRVHTGEKPYPCPVCGKGFSQSSQVKGHLRTHR